MRPDQIAVQLYSVRDHCGTADDFSKSLDRLHAIGYRTVEVAGLPPDLTPAAARERIEAAGLAICGAHMPPGLIRSNPGAVAEAALALGVTRVAYPFPEHVDFRDAACVKAMISDLDAAGAALRCEGIALAYHHHAIEFIRLGDETVLDHILRATAPENLELQLDTYWVQFGGGNPAAWCRKAAGRLASIHCKDYAFTADNAPRFAEVGFGNLDFTEIIPAATAAGAAWFIVEQDTCPGDPFACLERSFRTMSQCLIEGELPTPR